MFGGSDWARAALVSLLVGASPVPAHAGGQGQNLPLLVDPRLDFLKDPPLARVLEEVTGPHPGAAPPRLVCVADPAIECVDRRLGSYVKDGLPVAGVRDFPVVSPNCPAPDSSCKPDLIPGAEFEGRLTVTSEFQPCNASDTASYAGTILSPPSSNPQPDPPSPRFVGQLAPGNGIYADRSATTHFVSSLPDNFPELLCAQWLKWRNDDKHATAADFLRFQVSGSSEVRVWVGYDTRATAPPQWLAQDFSDTGFLLGFTDNGRPNGFRIWKSNSVYLPDDIVQLGGNKAAGAQFPDPNSSSNYMVALTGDTGQTRCRTFNVTLEADLGAGFTTLQSASGEGCFTYTDDGYDADDLPPLVDGVGYLAGSGGPVWCDQVYKTPSSEDNDAPPMDGEVVRLEQSVLGATFGGLDRGGLISLGAAQSPALLCQPNGAGICGVSPAVVLVEPNGALTKPVSASPDHDVCSFPIRFARAGARGAVVLGSPADDVDEPAPGKSVFAEAHGFGRVGDVNVSLELDALYADNVNARLVKDGIEVPLDLRSGCDTGGANTNVTFDDEVAGGPPSACGPLVGTRRPAGALSALDGIPVAGTWELRLVDSTVHTNDQTTLLHWSVDVTTSQCSDGRDNDHDGRIDFDGGASLGLAGVPDPQCTSASKNREAVSATVGCGLGPELLLLLPLLRMLRRQTRARASWLDPV